MFDIRKSPILKNSFDPSPSGAENIRREDLRALLLDDAVEHSIVFVDGRYAPDLSRPHVVPFDDGLLGTGRKRRPHGESHEEGGAKQSETHRGTSERKREHGCRAGLVGGSRLLAAPGSLPQLGESATFLDVSSPG